MLIRGREKLLSAVNPLLEQLWSYMVNMSKYRVKKGISFCAEGLSILKSSSGNISKPVF